MLAAAEVRKLRQRVNDRMETNAALGLPPGGQHFGYRAALNDTGQKTYEIVEDEAAVIRESAERLLSGWAVGSIVKDLVARGVTGHHRMKVRDADDNVAQWTVGRSTRAGCRSPSRARCAPNRSSCG